MEQVAKVNEQTDVVSKIMLADDNEIEAVMQAVTQWYQEKFPDWEVIFLSLPKNDPERRKQLLDSSYAMLNR